MKDILLDMEIKSFAPQTMQFPEVEKKSNRLRGLIDRITKGGGGFYESPIQNVSLFRATKPNAPACAIYEPSLCISVQGAELIRVGREAFACGSGQYLLTSINLPATEQVLKADAQNPYLGFKLKLDLREIAQIIFESDIKAEDFIPPSRGIVLGNMDYNFADALYRLVSLIESPEDIPVLSPLVQREIIYRLLSGPHGWHLKQLVTGGSPTSRMSKAINWLKCNFREKMKIADMAAKANMSISAFHKHFRAMTLMTPLQYQKFLRLSEARKIMLSSESDVADAAYNVGYESVTQFCREYKRLFGDSPRRDIMKQLP